MLAGGLVSGSVTGTYYSLFQKEISKIPTVTPSLFAQNHRITRHHILVTRYKNGIKTAATGRQPVNGVTSFSRIEKRTKYMNMNGGKLEFLKDTLFVFTCVLESKWSSEQVICCQIYHWLSVSRQLLYHPRFALVKYHLHV